MIASRPARFSNISLGWVFAVFLAACQGAQPPGPVSPTAAPRPLASQTLVPTASPTPSPKPTATNPPPRPTATPFPAPCSPLAGIAAGELDELVVNPYLPPPAGSDDPHQGVDLAILDTGTRIALAGSPVHAVLPGRVAATIGDRFPYGNAVLIETPLESIPKAWAQQIGLPTPMPPLPPHPALTCPPAELSPAWPPGARSLYTLYAHLAGAPVVEAGEAVSCGQPLGAIGSSGNALNPHLHLEIRVGPTGASFSGMAHYLASASPEEMGNYCLWRVSGFFQTLDPLRLFADNPAP